MHRHYNAPIKNNQLLHESYQSGYRQGLQEQLIPIIQNYHVFNGDDGKTYVVITWPDGRLTIQELPGQGPYVSPKPEGSPPWHETVVVNNSPKQEMHEQAGAIDAIIAQSGAGAMGQIMWMLVMSNMQSGNYVEVFRQLRMMLGMGILTASQYSAAVSIFETAIAGGSVSMAALIAALLAKAIITGVVLCALGYGSYCAAEINVQQQSDFVGALTKTEPNINPHKAWALASTRFEHY